MPAAPMDSTPTSAPLRWHANVYAWGVLGYSGLLFWLSSRSDLQAPLHFPNGDKVVHAGAYGILGILLCLAVNGYWSRWGAKTTSALVLGMGSFYGVTDELHQRFVPNRTCDVWDWAADTTGVLLGVITYRLAHHYWAGHVARRARVTAA